MTHADAPLRLVVFDVDGTLIDGQAQHGTAMAAAFSSVGLPVPPRERSRALIGVSLPETMRRLAPEQPEEVVQALDAAYRRASVAEREAGRGEAASPLYPGAREAVLHLAARDEVLLGVATGKARRGLAHALQVHGLEGRFQTLQTADTHPSKPHPSMLLEALGETGVEARHAVMVGDTTFDMEMARGAGMTA
ncbi:MAG: HAD-IA family hydrolase, partial [Pseudomonadota bacterium]